jgi:hypothetical protein
MTTMGFDSLAGRSFSPVCSDVFVTEDSLSEVWFGAVVRDEELEEELSSGGVIGGGTSAVPMEDRSASARAER